MIIISESTDISTNKVLDWLHYYKTSAIRINVEADFSKFSYELSNNKVQLLPKYKVVWCRRGYLPVIPINLKNSNWINYLKNEQLPLLFSIERNCNIIGSYQQEFNNNKILNLEIAAKVGLKIPDTIVTNNKFDLLKFIKKDREYITKSLRYPPFLKKDDLYYTGSGTIEFNLNEIGDYFAPSLIQEKIQKDIEIRIFFIDDDFFSMAIFSQLDELTKVDFRNYNYHKPNRNIPFKLPNRIKIKLRRLLKLINYRTCSIDVILTPKGEYVFLEINPMGQYDWISTCCNYYIDKRIAEMLINYKKNG